MSWTDRLDEGLAERDVAEADNELERTNQLLATLVENLTDEQVDELGYFGGGESTAAVAATERTTEEAPRVHFGKAVSIAGSDTKDDPLQVALPFKAAELDLRGWSGTIYLSFRDPEQNPDDSLWYTVDGAEAPVTELPVDTTSLWLATPVGSTAEPQIDAWVRGRQR